MVTNPIADFLTRIRNAARARHNRVELPSSKLSLNIAKSLREEGYIADVHEIEREGKKSIVVLMRYDKNKFCVIDSVRQVSKPGHRVYVQCDNIPKIRNGLGVAILSTSKGIITDRVARKIRVGGEFLCEAW